MGSAIHMGRPFDIVADIDRVGVAGGDGDDSAFPAAVQVFAGPAVGDVEIFVHTVSLSFRARHGKAG